MTEPGDGRKPKRRADGGESRVRVSPLDPAAEEESQVFRGNREGPPARSVPRKPVKREAITVTLGKIDPRRGW